MKLSNKKKCHAIIHAAAGSAAGVGAGLAQIPGSDAPVLVAIQTAMIISLGAVFDAKITESAAKSVIADALGVTVGRVASQILCGWLPGLGNAVNATTAAGLTEAIGWAAAKEFAKEYE